MPLTGVLPSNGQQPSVSDVKGTFAVDEGYSVVGRLHCESTKKLAPAPEGIVFGNNWLLHLLSYSGKCLTQWLGTFDQLSLDEMLEVAGDLGLALRKPSSGILKLNVESSNTSQ